MSRLPPHQMTVRKVESLKDGSWCDGGNLWITVKGTSRTWSFRFKSPVTGRRREMGLGSAIDLSLAGARQQAAEARKLLSRGLDPIEDRKELRANQKRQAALSFEDVAKRYILEQTPAWKDPRRADIWSSSLERLAYPQIGRKEVMAITTEDVLTVLRPIWTTINETADRVRGRIERILDYARTHGWREGENPARWKGHLANILPKPSAVSKVVHQAAVPWKDIGAVMDRLAVAAGISPLAARFTCLTAARPGEVRGARWSEVDLEARLWSVPADRTKMGREHRVPLSEPALEILRTLGASATSREAFIFPGGRPKRPLSDVAVSKALHAAAGSRDVTVHGLRSTFRDWVAEATDHAGEVSAAK